VSVLDFATRKVLSTWPMPGGGSPDMGNVSADGKTLMARQEFEDADVIENRGARLMAWDRQSGERIYPYECDPTFVLNYNSSRK